MRPMTIPASSRPRLNSNGNARGLPKAPGDRVVRRSITIDPHVVAEVEKLGGKFSTNLVALVRDGLEYRKRGRC